MAALAKLKDRIYGLQMNPNRNLAEET